MPKPERWNSLWQQALARLGNGQNRRPGNLTADILNARIEIAQAAWQYTTQYRDVDFQSRDRTCIIMSGHQPELFHPGVWFKNFVLANLGGKFNCLAINLVVDNDVGGPAAINVPVKRSEQNWHVQQIKFDSGMTSSAYEERTILDRQCFDHFGQMTLNAIQSTVTDPIIKPLWKRVSETRETNLGLAISKGRHLLEQDYGIETLELPVSILSQTRAFQKFANQILFRLPEFAQVYNDVVDEYRTIHRIKNRAQPVPNLKHVNGWQETPFWVWTTESPGRRSMFCKTGSSRYRDLRSKTDHETVFQQFITGRIQ